MTQGPLSPFHTALEKIREVFTHYRHSPSVLIHSLELEDRTRDASRAAVAVGMPLVAASAEFGRVAAESLPTDRLAGITIARAMTRWAAEVYHRGPVVGVTVS